MRVVIVGAGTLGTRTARLLLDRGHDVVVVEIDTAAAEAISQTLDCGLIAGDGTRPAVLSEVDPRHSDVLLALASDAQTNLIVSLVGRSLGFTRVMTRIDDEEFEHVTIELGVSETVIPARAIARHLADLVEGNNIIDLSSAIKGDAILFMFVAAPEDEGVIQALPLPPRARVSHLFRDGEFMLGEPDFELCAGDEVVIIAHRETQEVLRRRWSAALGGAPR